MAVKIQTAQGAIEIENDVIATIVGGAVTDNYGVVGMASQNPLRDGVNQILNGDSFSKGVVVRQQDGGVHSRCSYYCWVWLEDFRNFKKCTSTCEE